MPTIVSKLKPLAVAAVALALSACATAFRSDVATFHTLPAPNGEKLAIMPMDEAKRDSIEFQQYAAILGGHLRDAGYQQAGDAKPDLIVGFDVTINDGREKLVNRPNLWGPDRFYWGSYWRYGYYWEPFRPFDYPHNEIVAKTVYNAMLVMEVRKPDGELLFEGRAETETRDKALPEVVPLLMDALFQNYPGPSGVTRHVKIDQEK